MRYIMPDDEQRKFEEAHPTVARVIVVLAFIFATARSWFVPVLLGVALAYWVLT